jgi:hypothetical protein
MRNTLLRTMTTETMKTETMKNVDKNEENVQGDKIIVVKNGRKLMTRGKGTPRSFKV